MCLKYVSFSLIFTLLLAISASGQGQDGNKNKSLETFSKANISKIQGTQFTARISTDPNRKAITVQIPNQKVVNKNDNDNNKKDNNKNDNDNNKNNNNKNDNKKGKDNNKSPNAQAQNIQKQIAQAQAVEAFERRVAEMLTLGARDLEMAMRWIHEAEDTGGDNDYLAWTLGLPYRYFA